MDEQKTTSMSPNPNSHLFWWVGILLIVGLAVISWLSMRVPRGAALVDNFPEFLRGLQNDEQKRIGQVIFDSYREYRHDAQNWSAVAFGSLFMSAACSAVAGVVLKLEFFLKNETFKKDLAAILAMLAALLVTLSTVGGFHQRWAANRLAAAKMEKLAIGFMTAGPKSDFTSFTAQIQSIAFERNEGIVSTASER